MAKKVYYLQNNGHLSTDPPEQLDRLARECWRKVVPFLESTNKIQRIDSSLVELYCVQYEIYRKAYDDIKENGIQNKAYRSLQDSTGAIIGKDFVGHKKNPAVGTMKDAINQMTAVGTELGLSPKSRAELFKIVKNTEEKSTVESMKEFFNK